MSSTFFTATLTHSISGVRRLTPCQQGVAHAQRSLQDYAKSVLAMSGAGKTFAMEFARIPAPLLASLSEGAPPHTKPTHTKLCRFF
jgi:hypothetical protein